MRCSALAICVFASIVSSYDCAAADDPPEMTQVGSWTGPFEGTRIIKWSDPSDGVACYLFIPMNVATSTVYSRNKAATQFNGSIGSISCVKVATPPAPSKSR
jgi:hypothetical protein